MDGGRNSAQVVRTLMIRQGHVGLKPWIRMGSSSWRTSWTTSLSDGKETHRISSTWHCTLSTITLFLDSTSVTVPLPQQVIQQASSGFTYTSSPTVIFACPCSTLSIMACGCRHSYVKTDRCGTDTSSWPVFSAMLYQKTASWGEIWLYSATAFMVRWCLAVIPLLLRWYADLKYCLTPHFSHICLKTSEWKPTPLSISTSSTGPLSRNTSSTTLSISFAVCSDSLPYHCSPRSTVNHG